MKLDLKLLELFRELVIADGDFRKWIMKKYSYDLFLVSAISEIASDYKKYLRT